MAAFTPEDPEDRQRFDAHMVRIMESPENTLGARPRSLAGSTVPCGGGASPVRPLPGLRATTQSRSGCLRRMGFRVIDTEVTFAPARGGEIEETILRLG